MSRRPPPPRNCRARYGRAQGAAEQHGDGGGDHRWIGDDQRNVSRPAPRFRPRPPSSAVAAWLSPCAESLCYACRPRYISEHRPLVNATHQSPRGMPVVAAPFVRTWPTFRPDAAFRPTLPNWRCGARGARRRRGQTRTFRRGLQLARDFSPAARLKLTAS